MDNSNDNNRKEITQEDIRAFINVLCGDTYDEYRDRRYNRLYNTFMNRLEPEEQIILMDRFGWFDGIRHSLQELAGKYNLPRERIQWIETKMFRGRCVFRKARLSDYLD